MSGFGWTRIPPSETDVSSFQLPGIYADECRGSEKGQLPQLLSLDSLLKETSPRGCFSDILNLYPKPNS